MIPKGHSPLGASSAHRWLACPGSVRLSKGIKGQSSSFALEGSAAHQLGEECLLQGVTPHSRLGSTVSFEDDDGVVHIFPVDADMANAVDVYTSEVWATCRATGLAPDVEKLFHLDWLDEQLWGLNDASLGQMFDVLNVWDYKHGAGIAVEVQYPEPVIYHCGGSSDKNPQLMYYALGAVGNGNPNCHSGIMLGVVQPRAIHPDGAVRKCGVSIPELMAWQEEVLLPGLALTRSPNAPLCAGDHCRFCNARPHCPEIVKEASRQTGLTAAQVFGTDKLVFPDPADLTPHQRVRIYQLATAFSSWIDAVKKDTKARGLAGHDLPGMKVVKGKGSRKWADEEVAEAALKQYFGDDAYNPKLKSPAQVEAFLKSLDRDGSIFDGWVEWNYSKAIALETDKRPALCIETAAEVFNGGVQA